MPSRALACLFFCVLAIGFSGCSTEATRGAAQGAGHGAAIGAVGGAVTALVFGGDVGEAAARGAVWGGSTGAVSGGMQGAQVAEQKRSQEEQRKAAELAKLRREIGDDAYLGLEALADCKMAVAMAYFETAQQSKDPNYSLAGHWLEVLGLAEQGRMDEATALVPELVQADPKLKSEAEAVALLKEVKADLAQIRKENGISIDCR